MQGHVKEASGDEFQSYSRQLGAYSRGGLTARNEAKVDEHLSECNKCTAILLQVNDVGASMRGIIAPLFLGGLTALGIPAALTSSSFAGGAGMAGASASGATAGTASGSLSAGAGATLTTGAASGSTFLGGIGAFIGANALALAIAGVAVAAVVTVAAVGASDLGRKSNPVPIAAEKNDEGTTGGTDTGSSDGVSTPEDLDAPLQEELVVSPSTLPGYPRASIDSIEVVATQWADAPGPLGQSSEPSTNPGRNPVSSSPHETQNPVPSDPTDRPFASSDVPIAPTVSTDPTINPTESAEPTESTDPTVVPTTEPTDSTDPTEEPTEPTDPTVVPTTEPTDPTVVPTTEG